MSEHTTPATFPRTFKWALDHADRLTFSAPNDRPRCKHGISWRLCDAVAHPDWHEVVPPEPVEEKDELSTLRARLAEAESENTRYRKRYGCLTCGELHDRDSMCPPHEVRSSAMTDADRLARANAKLAEAEQERDAALKRAEAAEWERDRLNAFQVVNRCARERDEERRLRELAAKDHAELESAIREALRPALGAAVDGDGCAVPGLVELVERVVSDLTAARERAEAAKTGNERMGNLLAKRTKEGDDLVEMLSAAREQLAMWELVKRAASEENWAEFVTPEVFQVIDRLKSKCCRSLLREACEHTKQIAELTAQVARLREALEQIAKYGRSPYGCDTPSIARAALAGEVSK